MMPIDTSDLKFPKPKKAKKVPKSLKRKSAPGSSRTKNGYTPTPKRSKRTTRNPRKTTAAEKRHLEAVAGLGCVINNHECSGRSTVHHCFTGVGRRKNHFNTICLCWNHHLGPQGIDGKRMGKRVWEAKYGTEEKLLEITFWCLFNNILAEIPEGRIREALGLK